MYFKEREYSPLYLHYQKQEHDRLYKKLQEIKTRKQKSNNSAENLLPPITHRPSQPKSYVKKMITAQTDRHNKRLNELKSHKSEYFSKVIGLNTSLQLLKTKRVDTNKENLSLVVEPKKEQDKKETVQQQG